MLLKAALGAASLAAGVALQPSSVSQRYDYGWGDGVVPEEHAHIRALPEVSIGILVDLRPRPLPFVSKLEALHFLGAYCGVRVLNSRPDTPARYRLDALNMRASMAEGIAGIAALAAAGASVVIPGTNTSNDLFGAVADGLNDDATLDLVLEHELHRTRQTQSLLASGGSRDLQVKGESSYGHIWRSSPSYCDEVRAILRLVRHMGWRLFSVVRSLDVFGNAWAVCYDDAVRAVFPEGNAPEIVCYSAVRLDMKSTAITSRFESDSHDLVTGLGILQSDKARHVGMHDAAKCIDASRANIVVLWMRSVAANHVLRTMNRPEFSLSRIRIIGTAEWATFRPNYLSLDQRIVPTDIPLLHGAVYFRSNTLPDSERSVLADCVASLNVDEHPFIRDSVEELHMCRIPRPYTELDPMPDIRDYGSAPVCGPDASLDGLMLAPQGFGEFALMQHLDSVYRTYGTLTAETLDSSGLFSDTASGSHALRLMQLAPGTLDETMVGQCTASEITVDAGILAFGKGIGAWYPAYRVDEITLSLKRKLTLVIWLSLALSLVCKVLVFVLRNHAVVRKSSPGLSQLVLLGIDLALVSQLIWNETPRSVLACTAKVWIFLTGIGLVLGALLARLYRLDAIFNKPQHALQRRFRDMRDHVVAARIVLPVLAGELAIAAMCTMLPGGPPYPWIDLIDDTKEAVCTCSLSTSLVAEALAILVGVIYNAALVFAALRLAFRTRGGAAAYSEPRQLAMTVYFYALACAVIMPLYYTIFFVWRPVEENAADGLPRYRVLGIVMCALGTIVILFAPKVAVALMSVVSNRRRPVSRDPQPTARIFSTSALKTARYASAAECGVRMSER